MCAQLHEGIHTRRLHLRPLRADDTERLFSLFANWEVIRWLSRPPWPYTVDDARDFVAAQLALQESETRLLAITLGGALIGGIDAIPDEEVQAPVLGYWLGQPFWGQGYMTEAARAFVAQLFASMPGDTIYSGAFADNEASRRVLGKLGFEHDREGLVFCRPHNAKRPHVTVKLSRTRFQATTP